MSLKEKVMVVNLRISQWTARKYDAKASSEVATSHAARDAGRFNKILIAGDVLKKIGKVGNSARTYHYQNTLPWGDNGDRILPSTNFFNYTAEMGKHKSEFDALVSEFVTNYPSLMEDAKARLNTLFNEGDYPPQEFVQKKFGLGFSIMPIADVEDFRVEISEDEVNRIKTEIQGELTSRVDHATGEMLKRMRKAAEDMFAALSVNDKVFRDSLVGNIHELVEIVPLLNFNKDKHIDACVDALKPLCVEPAELRKNAEFRKEMAEKARQVSKFI